jgi:cathepsin D
VASAYSDDFDTTNYGADGLIGMGTGENSPFNTTNFNFFVNLVEQDQLEDPVFGFYLADSDSELIIGGRDDSRYSGELSYVDANVTVAKEEVRILRGVPCLRFNTGTDSIQGYWQTTFDAITANGNVISVGTQNAIIDTGTTLVLGDRESISNIYEMIPGSASLKNTGIYMSTLFTVLTSKLIYVQMTVPCNTSVTVSITFGGTRFNISPKAYNMGQVDKFTNSTCFGGFAAAPSTITGEQNPLDRISHESYVQQDSG